MKKKKSSWVKILSDSLMIIFSVLIALFLNEYRDNQKEKNRTEQILNNIKLEIKANQEYILELKTDHEVILKRIKKAYEEETLEEYFFPNNTNSFTILKVAPNGIIQKSLGNIAWEVAKEEKITNRIPFQQSKSLFSVYDQQKTILESIDQILLFIDSREIYEKSLLQKNTLMLIKMFYELTSQEIRLKQYYLKALETL